VDAKPLEPILSPTNFTSTSRLVSQQTLAMNSMRKIMYIALTVLVFALGWLSHLIIRGDASASDHCKNLDQDTQHIQIVPHQPIELQPLKHRVIHEYPLYQREVTDRRYCVWTDDQDKAKKMLKEFSSDVPDFQLRKGEVLAVFMNDMIEQVLIQIVHNKRVGDAFADYADSGERADRLPPQEGKKYTQATAVVFTPIHEPNYLGMRGMVEGECQKSNK